MGCATSAAKQIDTTEDVPPFPDFDNSSLIDGRSVKESTRAAAMRPRSVQRLAQKIVSENFNRDVRDYYDIDKQVVLGSGISGSVRICEHILTGSKYALKTLSKRKLDREKLVKLKEEVHFMADLDHPNILRLIEYFETNDSIYLILELCRGGELLERLHEQKGSHYSEKVACKYVHTMLSAISYCHARNIVHRDIKLENFLFESMESDSELKLIDFGLSHYFTEKEVLHKPVGTPYYVAPEVLLGNYNAKCDVWSIGVIAYMLLSGIPPFYGRTDAETLQCVKVGKWKFEETLFAPVSAEAKSLITALLTRRVSARPSASEALSHPWFNLLKNNRQNSSDFVSLDIITRLEGFVKRTSLSKVCMEVVAHTLQPEQIAELRKHFVAIDSTGSGEITFADLRKILAEHRSFNEQDLNHIFSGVDLDNVGKISYHEFLAATISRKAITDQNLLLAFDKLSNHSKYITCEDIQDLLGSDASMESVQKMLAEVNLPPNSQISFTEFKHIMNGGYSSPMAKSPYIQHSSKLAFSPRSTGLRSAKKGRSAATASADVPAAPPAVSDTATAAAAASAAAADASEPEPISPMDRFRDVPIAPTPGLYYD